MLVQVFHGSQIGFFELAASLLPVFLLAGIVTERVSPSRSESYSRILSHVGLIPAFALLALVAEFLSINSVATGNSVAIFRWFVCVALVASMVLVVFLLWIPWWQSLYDKDPISAKKYKRLFNWSVIPLAIIGVLLLGQGVENGVAVEGANTYEHRYSEMTRPRRPFVVTPRTSRLRPWACGRRSGWHARKGGRPRPSPAWSRRGANSNAFSEKPPANRWNSPRKPDA